MYELLSPLVYANADENHYFGLTYASHLKIIIPKPVDSLIRDEEMSIRMMSNIWKHKAAIQVPKVCCRWIIKNVNALKLSIGAIRN